MFIDFEGIDGSGKTTLSNLVAARLKKLGHRVAHARESGTLQSPAARRIRELTRDSQLLELAPRTEFFLNVARDAQQLAEIIRPSLERGEICISDRYLYSQLALSGAGRGLPLAELEPTVRLASQGIWPDLVVLVDVDPDLARLRKRLGKLGQPKGTDSRKNLAGAGLSVRVREEFLRMAHGDPARWLIIENNDQPLWLLEQRIVEAIVARLEGRDREVQPLLPRKRPTGPVNSVTVEAAFERALDDLEAREPGLCAFLLSGIPGIAMHRRRLGLIQKYPAVIARGLAGLRDEASWALRESLASQAPADVISSLGGDPSARAMTLREILFEQGPKEVVAGLKNLNTDRAWLLRERACDLGYLSSVLEGLVGIDSETAWSLRDVGERAGMVLSVAKSLTGIAGQRADEMRARLLDRDRLAVLRSTTGIDSPFVRSIREGLADRATKVVLRSLTGVDVEYGWVLRRRFAETTKEAIDSVDGMDCPEAWALREAYADRWATTVLSSIRPLPLSERARALVDQILSGSSGRLPVLRNAYATVAVGTNPEHRQKFAARSAALEAPSEQQVA